MPEDPKHVWLSELAGDFAEMVNPCRPGSPAHVAYEQFRADLIGAIGRRGLMWEDELDAARARAAS